MNVQIFCPTYDSRVDCNTVQSLVSNVFNLKAAGHKVALAWKPGNCYIQDARNHCCNDFVNSVADVMLFVDSDLAFPEDSILKLVNNIKDKEILAGIYPFKLQPKAGIQNWPVCFDGNATKIEKDGTIEATWIPTGFMMITQKALKRWREFHKDKVTCDKIYLYFECGKFWEDERWYGEDIYFCKRFREAGGKIFVYPDITFTHSGLGMKQEGNYANCLKSGNVKEGLEFK
jgi:GTP:adenosylcobinamide-phosphate guanylyltransferase